MKDEGFSEYMDMIIASIAASFGVPYEQLIGDGGMVNIDAGKVFFENEDGRVCLGGGPFELVLICTRTGGFEVWSSVLPGGRILAGGAYKGPSKITIGDTTVWEQTPEEWHAFQEEERIIRGGFE